MLCLCREKTVNELFSPVHNVKPGFQPYVTHATQELADGIAGICHVIQDNSRGVRHLVVIRWVETFRQFLCSYTTADWINLRTTEFRQMPTLLSRKSNLEGVMWKQWWNILWSWQYISMNKLNSPFCLMRSRKMSVTEKRCFSVNASSPFWWRIRFILAYYCHIFPVCVSPRCVRCVRTTLRSRRCVTYFACVRVETVLNIVVIVLHTYTLSVLSVCHAAGRYESS